MRAEIRFIPLNSDKEVVSKGLDPHAIRGYHLRELDVAAVKIQSVEEIDKLILFLEVARLGFWRKQKTIDGKYDNYTEVTDENNSQNQRAIGHADSKLLPGGNEHKTE